MKNTHCDSSKTQLCKTCMMFYGSEVFQGQCSDCHKISQHKNKRQRSPKNNLVQNHIVQKCQHETLVYTQTQLVQSPKVQFKSNKKRCFDCNRKVGLLGLQCKCGLFFCKTHRLPQDHNCSFDFKAAGKKQLQKQMVKVQHVKITQI